MGRRAPRCPFPSPRGAHLPADALPLTPDEDETMTTALRRIALLSLLLGAAPAAAHGQSDILLRLRSGSPLGDRFRVDSASGFVAKGVLGVGIIPFTGAGNRLMWHPNKAAFRAGEIGSAGTQWGDPHTGHLTRAGGDNTPPPGLGAVALGDPS